MKKAKIYLMMLIISTSLMPNMMLGASGDNSNLVANDPKEIPAEVKVQLERLEEIKAIDRSTLSSSERKALRKEVRAIKTNLVKTGNGVYLSVGAIIIIVLLLILLL